MALMTHHTTSTTTVNTTCSVSPSAMRPPTCNQLDTAQRSRLIKSTRKLGKVLGTTPCVLESLSPLPTLPPKTPMTDVAAKRRSAPPTPTGSLVEFISRADDGRSQKQSFLSDDENKSSSSHTYLPSSPSLSSLHRKKPSFDALGPIPVFSDSTTGRRKPKRLQPVMRLPQFSAKHAVLASQGQESPPLPLLPDYKLEPSESADPAMTPLPVSPTTSVSPSSTETEMPPTPPSKSTPDPLEETLSSLPEDVLSYPGLDAYGDAEASESRLLKRRMEKLMRHLGECVPSELVLGSAHRRESKSFSASLVTPTRERADGAPVSGIMKDAQTRVMRRVSVLSGQRKQTQQDETESVTVNSGCLSDPEPGNSARIHTILMREKSRIHIQRGERQAREKSLVEDEWTPEAYEDVVKRLRRLK